MCPIAQPVVGSLARRSPSKKSDPGQEHLQQLTLAALFYIFVV
jgi:hypothetical protein